MPTRAISIIRAINRKSLQKNNFYSVIRQICSNSSRSNNFNDRGSSSSLQENPGTKGPGHKAVEWGDEDGSNFTAADWEEFRLKEGLSSLDETNLKDWEKRMEVTDLSENVFEDAFGFQNKSRKPTTYRIAFEFEGSMEAIADFDPTIRESDLQNLDKMGFPRPSINNKLEPEINVLDKKTSADGSNTNKKPLSPSPTPTSDLPRSKRARKQALGEKPGRENARSLRRAPSTQVDLDFDLPVDPKKEKYENRVAGLQEMFSSLVEDVLSRKSEWSRIDCEIQRILLSPNRRNLTIYYSTEHKPDPQTRKALRLWWKNTISDIKCEISSQMNIKHVPNVFVEISKVKESNIDELFDQIEKERSTTLG